MTMFEMIQPGWTVVDSNGEEVGAVLAADEHTIRIRKQGMLGGEAEVARDKCSNIEEGRVELSVAKGDL